MPLTRENAPAIVQQVMDQVGEGLVLLVSANDGVVFPVSAASFKGASEDHLAVHAAALAMLSRAINDVMLGAAKTGIPREEIKAVFKEQVRAFGSWLDDNMESTTRTSWEEGL